mgnify:CR=1 FL=1
MIIIVVVVVIIEAIIVVVQVAIGSLMFSFPWHLLQSLYRE